MGKKNIVWNHYLRDKRRFADVVNGFLYKGEQIVKAEELEDLSTVYAKTGMAGGNGEQEESSERIRDIRMSAKTGETYCLYALENQQNINYAMPFRCMEYDAMEYGKQLKEIRKRNTEEKNFENDSEWLCKVKKTDKLSPIYTICLYHGEEPWDGPRSLKDMMNFGEDGDALSRYFADYPMRLVCLNEKSDYKEFRTEVRKVFRLMNLRKNRKLMQKEFETNPDYKDVDVETVEAISVMLDAPEIWERRNGHMKNEEREGNDMCQAIREMLEDARTEGRIEGRTEGISFAIIQLLSEKGFVSERIQQEIRAQMSADVLQEWIVLVARANSVEAFVEATGLNLE